MDERESWTLKKAECQKNWCFWTVVLEKTLGLQGGPTVHANRDQSWTFIGRTDVECEIPILCPPDANNWLIWKDPDAWKDWKQEEKGTREDEIVGWHHQFDGHESEYTPAVGSGQGPGLLLSKESQKVRQDWMTELNWTELNILFCM